MTKLPRIEIKEAPLWQTIRLTAWLDEWETEMRLREGEATSPLPEEAPPGPLATDVSGLTALRRQEYDEQVHSGQIRLLSSHLLPRARRPIFVAVLSEWTGGLKLVAPYGPFAEPASAGELLTTRPDSALKVLCLWNSHTLPDEAIARSWVVDDLAQAELNDAWAVFEQVAFGKALAAGLAERVGPPICHPRDPRRQYQEEELAVMSPLAGAAIQWERERIAARGSNVINIIPLLAAFLTARALREAASVPEAATKQWTYRAPGLDVELVLRLESDQHTLGAYVYDLDGEESHALDGAFVLDQDQNVAGTITGGRARIVAEAVQRGFILRASSGTPVTLSRKA